MRRNNSHDTLDGDNDEKTPFSPAIKAEVSVITKNKALQRAQIKIFFLTYFGYMCTHIQREFWSMSKQYLKPELGFDDQDLSNFDFAQLLAYAISVYALGIIGDSFNKKIVLTIVYFFCGIFYCLQGLGGLLTITHKWYFYLVFIFIGFGTSLIFPSFIGILGDWFPKTNRGVIIGVWATCIQLGNIIGVQIARLLLNVYGDDHWYIMMFTAGVLMGVMAILFFFFLVGEPE